VTAPRSADPAAPRLAVRDRDRDWPAERIPASVEAWLRELGGPLWLGVRGRDRSRTRVVTTLLHGDEPSGVRAVHAWLRAGAVPATDLVLLVVGVDAALAGPGFAHRVRPGGRDWNRVWLPPHEGAEGAVAREVLRRLEALRPEALVDLHNTSGHTPPYAVGPSDGPAALRLAGLFAPRLIHSRLRLGAVVEATDALCPSVTVECGRGGDPAADALAREGLARFAERDALGLDGSGPAGVEILANPRRVSLSEGVRLAFAESPVEGVDLTVRPDVDRHNFEWLEPGRVLGWVRRGVEGPLQVLGEDGRDHAPELFSVRRGVLEIRRRVLPVMMTTDARSAELDCLFYVVQPRSADPAP